MRPGAGNAWRGEVGVQELTSCVNSLETAADANAPPICVALRETTSGIALAQYAKAATVARASEGEVRAELAGLEKQLAGLPRPLNFDRSSNAASSMQIVLQLHDQAAALSAKAKDHRQLRGDTKALEEAVKERSRSSKCF